MADMNRDSGNLQTGSKKSDSPKAARRSLAESLKDFDQF